MAKPKKPEPPASGLPAHLAAAIDKRGDVPPPADQLERVRDAARRLRDLYQEKENLSARATEVQAKITAMETAELVDLFNEVKVPAISIEANGNAPAADFEKQPFYSAKIPEGRDEEAMGWFEAEGHGDLIKTSFTIAFGMGERKTAVKLQAFLDKAAIEYGSKVGVHAGSLLAFVKKELQAGRKIPLDLLGAYVGEIVKMKPRKEKK